MTFYVIDSVERSVSWDDKTEKGERFSSQKAAEKKAKELAEYEPGKMFEIVQVIAKVECPVGAPKILNC